MRVGLVIYDTLDTLSGGYLYDRLLVRQLERHGDTVKIISLPWRNYARHLADNVSADLRRRLAGPFDVLVQDELNHPSLAWANGLCKGGAPIVSIVHHLRSSEPRQGPLNAIYRRVERRYLRSVDAFVFNSRTTQRVVEGLVGDGRPAIVAWPAGDRLPRPAKTATIHDGPLRLLFVGNLIPRKGLHVLLAALARLPGEAWQLTVVGRPADEAYDQRMRALAERALPAGRVLWRGGLDGASLAAEMVAADALVVPSTYEGFGIVYLEAMGFGRPAIATTAGGAAEIITDGVDGFLVPPDDPATLAARLALLAGDRVRLSAMSAAAAARFARHPTWDDTTAAIRAFLLTLAGREASSD